MNRNCIVFNSIVELFGDILKYLCITTLKIEWFLDTFLEETWFQTSYICMYIYARVYFGNPDTYDAFRYSLSTSVC